MGKAYGNVKHELLFDGRPAGIMSYVHHVEHGAYDRKACRRHAYVFFGGRFAHDPRFACPAGIGHF